MKPSGDYEYKADKGKHFVLTEKGKEWASYRDYEVGKPIDIFDTYGSKSMVDQGALIEVDDPDFVVMPGYRAVYDVHGDGKHIFDTCNHIVYPDREMAECAAKEFNNRPWRINEQKAYVIDAVYEGKRPKQCREYNGKPVYNSDYWSFNRPIGSLVEENIGWDMINCVPPKCMRSNCMQCGEPASEKIDDKTNKVRLTYATFKKITDGIYEWCGDCFYGENIERGKEVPYTAL